MKCPNCTTEMNSTEVKTKVGLSIVIDQCPKCGGIWLDRNKLYQIPISEAEKIENIDKNLLHKSVKINEFPCCPRDSAPLQQFTDHNIPSDIHIQRCDLCGGVWLNKGELLSYKEEIKNKATKIKSMAGGSDDVPNPLASSTVEETTKTLERVGDFLMTPMDPHAPVAVAKVDIVKMEDPSQATISDKEAEILKEVPGEQKMAIYHGMIADDKYRIKDENTVKRIAMGLLSLLGLLP